MSLYLLIIAIVGTLFSLIMGYFVGRQVYKSRWIDARVPEVFLIFIIFILLLVIGLWVLYYFSL